MDSTLYIGIMSGTSADAIDLAIVDFKDGNAALIGTHTHVISNDIRSQIHSISLPGDNEIDRMGELDQTLGRLFAQATLDILDNYQLKPQDVAAIGSHGQTIRHRPPQTTRQPFTLQIGDPNLIAEITGITTVADFRRRDMAAGGQGAPLVPAFHRAIFQSHQVNRAIVNIGGMANISWLPHSGIASGFDTGPGNVLMDAWILKIKGKSYDQNGDWAASGKVNQKLLNQLLSHPFFAMLPPKSTGRESFNLQWLEEHLAADTIADEDIQATLLALTARSIADSIKKMTTDACEVFVCGGGAYNMALMEELARLMPENSVDSTDKLGIDPRWIEAMAFAWLAKQTMHRETGNLTAVTGAQKEVILGGVYFAN